jgi:hypothetical protein
MLDQPGAFLISDPEHTVADRHRAYPIDDARSPGMPRSTGAAVPRSGPAGRSVRRRPQNRRRRPETARPVVVCRDESETALLAALADADPDGVPVVELLALTGMTRPTLCRHLRAHADAGRAVQVSRGYWRAAGPARHDGPAAIPAVTGTGHQVVTGSDRNRPHGRLVPRARLRAWGRTRGRDETTRQPRTVTPSRPGHREHPRGGDLPDRNPIRRQWQEGVERLPERSQTELRDTRRVQPDALRT